MIVVSFPNFSGVAESNQYIVQILKIKLMYDNLIIISLSVNNLVSR